MGNGLWVFEYRYRDAGNYKTHGQLLLTGAGEGTEAALRACLEWDDQFVAEQVGVPVLCGSHWKSVGEGPSELDHAFHELAALRRAKADVKGAVWGTVEGLVGRFRSVAGKWDVRLSPNCGL